MGITRLCRSGGLYFAHCWNFADRWWHARGPSSRFCIRIFRGPADVARRVHETCYLLKRYGVASRSGDCCTVLSTVASFGGHVDRDLSGLLGTSSYCSAQMLAKLKFWSCHLLLMCRLFISYLPSTLAGLAEYLGKLR